MTQDDWQKVKGLFEVAVELAPQKRKRFLDKSCGKDDDLRREVENLLDSDENAKSFMEQSAAKEVASLIIEPDKKLQSGESLGHYKIIEQIGAGGMGEVYLAKDKKLDRRVAVKILNEKFSRDESNLRRFIQEAKAASGLNHPNILVIHEIGETDDGHFIVSEFIEGKTLREIVNQSPIKLSKVLDISIQIVNALTAAHAASIVHRDIKPENIIVRPDGYVKILDFGLAKLVEQKVIGLEDATVKQNETAKGIILGTVNYMSPEQAKGEKVDERTDIFSLGVVIYEMMAGRTPFAGDSMSETFANLINTEPQPLSRFSEDVPNELTRIVAKTLRKNKVERYQTMKDLFADLKSLQKRLEFEVEFGHTKSPQRITEKDTQIITVKEDFQKQTQNSIAVLPFANMSADAENEYFCDGLAEELLNALAKIKDLKVAARTSAFSFKNRNVDVSEIGKTLNVKTILEGSVRKVDNRLRISVQLVNAASGFHIWSERYDGELKDIFDLQDEITLAVIDELKVKFLSEEKAALRNRYAENVEAYQLYLKGRYHALKMKPQELQTGMSYFEQAIEIDPSYAIAFVGLAEVYQMLPLAAEFPAAEFFPKAKAAALRAIEIDDELAEAHGVLGWLLFWFDWDWNAAERECRRALELNPKSADAHEAYAHLLSNIGRHDEALAEIKLARELDPLNLRINALEGQFLLHAGQIDEALARLQKTFELEPNFWLAHIFAATAYIEKEMFAEAVAEADKAKQLSGGSSHAAAFGVYALAKSGKRAEANAALAEMLQVSTARHVPPYTFALAYQGLDEREKTFEWLEKGFEQRDPKMAFLKVEPKWNSLRSEPRFQDLLRRIGFPTDENADGKPTDETKQKTLEREATTDLTAQSQIGKSSVTGIIKNRKPAFIIGLIILLLTAGSFGYYFWSLRKSASSATGKKSLAVLPFINAGQDPNAEYLSDGITESVINNLSQLAGLRVMSRNSAFRFKNNQTDPRAIAAQLGVETLVTGDIKQLGDKLVINVRLIDATDDSQIWGNQYVKTSGDIIAAQNEIAQAVAGNLRLKLTNSEQQQLGKNYTENVKAYELYLRGRYHYSKATASEIRKGIVFSQQAVDVDPGYALAYAGIADAYRSLSLIGFVPSKETMPQAKAAAKKALEIDENLAEAHIVLGWVGFLYDWDWSAAENELKKAIELAPNNSDAHFAYAHLLSNSGRHTEAVMEGRRARELDPLALVTNAIEGHFLFFAGRDDEAIARLQKTLELEPNFWLTHAVLVRVYMRQKRYPEAIAESQKAKELSGGNINTVVTLGYALAKSGNRQQAQATLTELKSLAAENYIPAYSFATIYISLGEREEALKYLEKSFEERETLLSFIKIDTPWDDLRDEPRFVEIIKKMNLE